jgi:hypothetical protein
VDPQRLVQRSVERGAVITELLPHLLLLLGVGKLGAARRRAPLPKQGAGAGRGSLGAVPPAPGHHVVVPPSNKRPCLGLGGWRGQARPLVPPGRRDVVIRNLHRHRLGAVGEGGLLPRLHDHLRPRLRGRGLLLRRRGRCLQPRLSSRRRRTALRSRRCRQCHYNRRRRLYLPSRRASVATVACCTSTTAGARRASATAGCGATGDVTGRGLEALAAPRELSLAVAASLTPTRGTLDERRRVGMDASALSTLAGARGGMVGTALWTRKQIVKFPPDGLATPRRTIPYLKE